MPLIVPVAQYMRVVAECGAMLRVLPMCLVRHLLPASTPTGCAACARVRCGCGAGRLEDHGVMDDAAIDSAPRHETD